MKDVEIKKKIKNKKQQCLYCGLNPTPHAFGWFGNTMGIILDPMTRWSSRSFMGRLINRVLDKIQFPMLWFFELIRVVKWHSDIEDVPIGRAKVLWQDAQKRNIPIWGMIVFGKCVDVYKAEVNGRKIIFEGLPRITSSAESWMDDKSLLKKLFLKNRIPVARGGSFATFRGACKAFRNISKPVIVKPRLGSRGRHTITYIYTQEEFKTAFKIAQQLGQWVVVEEHLIGSVYRGTLIDGILRGVLRGDPPRITGDGKKTIKELVEYRNKHKPNSKVGDIVIDQKMEEFLARNKYTVNSILEKDTQIDVTEKIGLAVGGNAVDVTDQTHPEIKQTLEKAAQILGDKLVGFDFIIPDETKSPTEQKWGIIEANSMPFIDLHYDPVGGGKTRNIAEHIWNIWFEEDPYKPMKPYTEFK